MSKRTELKLPWKPVMAVAFGLTLATWIFFYVVTPDAPLEARSTTVVFGAWFLLASFSQLTWRRWRGRPVSRRRGGR